MFAPGESEYKKCILFRQMPDFAYSFAELKKSAKLIT